MRPRVLVSASRRNNLSFESELRGRVKRNGKVRDRETRSPDTRDACATQACRIELVCDRAQLFHQYLAFLAIVDHKRVVFSQSGPRSARHFTKIHKPPVGHICAL